MIFNTAVYGGIKEEDITAELLQSLDPDFKADNIAEGVDLFGLVGTLSGAKVATGTLTGNGSKTVTVTGLDFTPQNVMMVLQTNVGAGAAAVVVDGSIWSYSNGYGTRTATITYTNGGFSVTDSSKSYAFYSGHAWKWIAWAA